MLGKETENGKTAKGRPEIKYAGRKIMREIWSATSCVVNAPLAAMAFLTICACESGHWIEHHSDGLRIFEVIGANDVVISSLPTRCRPVIVKEDFNKRPLIHRIALFLRFPMRRSVSALDEPPHRRRWISR